MPASLLPISRRLTVIQICVVVAGCYQDSCVPVTKMMPASASRMPSGAPRLTAPTSALIAIANRTRSSPRSTSTDPHSIEMGCAGFGQNTEELPGRAARTSTGEMGPEAAGAIAGTIKET